MKRLAGIMIIVLVVLAGGVIVYTTNDNEGKIYADTVIKNGNIYTVDEKQPLADAVAIKGEKLLYVGIEKDGELEQYIGPDTEIIDIKGKLVIPGIVDGHTHPAKVMSTAWQLILPETDDPDELLSFIKDYCEKHPVSEAPYIYASCYPTDMFGKEGPKKELLDKYVSDRPVRIQDFTDHGCWLNSKALELMGVDKNTPDPAPGVSVFVRDAEGNPTGWAKEGATWNFEPKMFEAIGWWPPETPTPELIIPFIEKANDYGIMALMDGFTEGEEAIKSFYELDKQGKLNLYYDGACKLPNYAGLDKTIAQVKDWQKKYSSKHVKIDTVKFFLDGTNEIGTCAVLEPFSNDPTGKNYGFMNMTEEELTDVMVRLNEENLDLHIHMVGDRAFRTSCNAVEKAKEKCGSDWKIQVEFAHCELVDPEDMTRPAELGIIINWTPHWSGGYFGEDSKEWLGEERYNRMYDFTTMIKSGANVNYGSDLYSNGEFNRIDPYMNMQIGHTRIDTEYPVDSVVRAPQSAALSLEDLVKGYTLNSAIQLRMDDKMGTITTGKLANLVVLNKDLFKVADEDIENVEPTAVIFEGKVIRGEF